MARYEMGFGANETTYRERTLPYEELELSSGPIEYVDVGTGDPVIFLHGFMVNSEVWRNVIPTLEHDFRCVAPTLPLGAHHRPMYSEADLSPPGLVEILREFLDRLNIDRPTLVGNDAGGALCQIFIASYPKRVHRLILTNCDAFEEFPPKLFRPLQYASYAPGFTSLIAYALRFEWVRRLPFTYGWTTKEYLPREILDKYVQDFISNPAIRQDTVEVLQTVHPNYTRDAASAFPHIETPVLLLWSREDPIFPVEHAERLAEVFPNVKLEYLEDSYAFIPEDQPELLADSIRDFLIETEATSEVTPTIYEAP